MIVLPLSKTMETALNDCATQNNHVSTKHTSGSPQRKVRNDQFKHTSFTTNLFDNSCYGCHKCKGIFSFSPTKNVFTDDDGAKTIWQACSAAHYKELFFLGSWKAGLCVKSLLKNWFILQMPPKLIYLRTARRSVRERKLTPLMTAELKKTAFVFAERDAERPLSGLEKKIDQKEHRKPSEPKVHGMKAE